MHYWSSPNEEAGKNIFETCKTIIPPIITLVIGYYFGQSRDGRKSDKSILFQKWELGEAIKTVSS